MEDIPPPSFPVPARLPHTGLFIDLGSQARRRIRRLKGGDGQLAREIQAAVDQSRQELGIDPGTEIVPVVLLYRRDEPDYLVVNPQT
jgi:hypothetical protein